MLQLTFTFITSRLWTVGWWFFWVYMASCFSSFAQKVIVDSADRQPIAYVSVICKNNVGTYADENGRFKLACSPSDTLFFSRIGYHSKFCVARNLPDTIFLLSNNNLKEVVIKTRKTQNAGVELGYFDNKRGGHFTNVNQAALFIENTTNQEVKISKIGFQVSNIKFSVSEKENRVSNSAIIVRPRIYGVANDGTPDKDLLVKDLSKKIAKNQKKIEFDISDLDLFLPESGVFLSLEFIGYYFNKNEINFKAFDEGSNNKELLQFTPAFSKDHSTPKSWYKQGYGSTWKLIRREDSQINFNFGIKL